MSEDKKEKIIRQVEYYFGDANLSKDKFMNEEIKKDAGWILFDTLLKFNRLRILSTDVDEIVNALKESKSGLLEIDAENKKIRRAKELPQDFEATIKQNTLYVKGFPNTLSLDDLYGFFEPHGKVLQIFMRRYPQTKKFKGSVFVSFESNDSMKAVLDKKDELKYKDEQLIVELQEDYLKRKEKENEDRKKEKEEKRTKKNEEDHKLLEEKMRKGAIIKITGLGSEATREDLKELFDNHAAVDFVHYSRGEPEAMIRFKEENGAKVALEKCLEEKNNEIKVKESLVECKVLEGDEENNYWLNEIKFRQNRRNESNKRRKGGNKNKFNKKGGRNNKRRNDDDDDDDGEEGGDNDEENGDDDDGESPNKKIKS